jgi:hypothetical protein
MDPMAAPQPSLGDAGRRAPAQIAQLDISGPARALSVLRYSDYTLVVACGLGAIGVIPEIFSSAANGNWTELITQTLIVAVFLFAAYTGWRHVGVIDPRVWRAYPWVFAALSAVAVLMAGSLIMVWVSQGKNPLDDLNSLMGVMTGLWFAALAIPGFVAAIVLRRMRIASVGAPLSDLISGLRNRGGVDAPHATHVDRPHFRRGLFYAIAGGCILLAGTLTPAPSDTHYVSTFYRLSQQLNLLAFFLIVRARRYFQISADSLLAVDKRAPILFLRSFTDDERVKYGNSQNALLDFSLETRLANHFSQFGPFIAIGSPQETIPQPGAARVILSDDEWQSRVLGWMESANLIVMYCGTTKWVNWELQKIVERGRSTSLILMIPEIKGWRASKRRQDIVNRVQQLREVFRNTEWNEELAGFDDFASVRAMLFRADGSMVMIRSRSRSRDSYHLAALIAHQQLLDPTIANDSLPAAAPARKHRWLVWAGSAAAAGILAIVALAATGYYTALSAGSQPSRLAFKKGELYYNKPVTQAEAQRVGQFLVDREYFSDSKEISARLDRDESSYRLQFVVDGGSVDNLLATMEFSMMGQDISHDLVNGARVQVILTDNQWKPLKTAPFSAKLKFGAGELFYSEPVSASQADATGRFLKEIGFFGDGKGAAVHLGREQSLFQLRFIIDVSRIDDPAVAKNFRLITQAVSVAALGGEPVMLHLCDSEFHTLRSERLAAK